MSNILYKVKRVFVLLFEAIMIPLFIFCLLQGELVMYGIAQARGQLAIVWNARPIEEVLNDPAFPDSLKQKLRLVQEIKKFAVDSLGIKPSENYTTVYDQKGMPLLWVVTGSEPYALKAKEWSFPVLGSVSYKGFFVKSKAEKEQLALVANEYDTDIGRVGAWSTLGWFRDPILSNMLNNSEGDLANLIIHELTHGTLYVKNDVDFNENLASFVGDMGAYRFLEYKYGKQSEQYLDYAYSNSDEVVFDDYMLRSAARADSLYKTFTASMSKQEKEKRKHELLLNVARELYQIHFDDRDVELIKRINSRLLRSKNAFLMTFIRYDSEQDEFEKEYREKFHSDIKQYLVYLKKKYPGV